MKEVVHEFEDGTKLHVKTKPEDAYADFEYLDVSGDTEIYGSVKWDGCMNWSTSATCMYHFCEPSDVDHLKAVFQMVWKLGRQVMGEDKVDYFYPDDDTE